MSKQQILKDIGGTLYVEFDELPQTVTCTIYDYNGIELTSESSDNITIGSRFTMSGNNGLSQDDRRTIYAYGATISGISVMDTLRIENDNHQVEYAQCQGYNTTTGEITLDEELEFDYTDGDYIDFCVVERTISASEVDTLGTNYRARFKATMSDSTVEYEDVLFDVVNQILKQPLTVQNIHLWDPVITEQIRADSNGVDWGNLLNTAWNCVYDDIVLQNIRPDLILDKNTLSQVHLYKFKQLCLENNIRLMSEQTSDEIRASARYFRECYVDALNNGLRTISWYDKNEDQIPGIDDEEKKPVSYDLTL